MRVHVGELGKLGQVDEIPDYNLPPNAWTTANNVDFRDGVATKSFGYTDAAGSASPYDRLLLTGTGDPADDNMLLNTTTTDELILVTGVSTSMLSRPQWIMPYNDPDQGKLYWIYAGDNDSSQSIASYYDGDNHSDITNTATYATNYTSVTPSDNEQWSGAVVNGVAMLNNPNHIPQVWDRTSGTLNAQLSDVSTATNYWTSTETCRILRGFRNFFIAMDINDTAGNPDRNPYEIMHSDIVTSYTEPEWTPTTSNRAGSKYIGEGGGYIIDCLPLRGMNIVYTEREAWAMQFVGGNEVFAVDRITSEYGLYAPRCVKPFKDGRHFLVTLGDIVIFDGSRAESICDSRTRDRIFADIDTDNFRSSFVVSHYTQSEMWFFYPQSGNTYPNRIARWNIKTGAWSFMSLPDDIAHVAYGAVPESIFDVPWDQDEQVWDEDSAVWTQGNYNPSVYSLMMAHYDTTVAGSALFKGDDSNTFNGSTFTSVLQRTGLTLAGYGQNGIVSDPNTYKHVDEIWPQISGGPMRIRVGGKAKIGDTYKWEGPYMFDPTTDYKIDLRTGGRYLAVEFSSSDDVGWTLTGYDLNIQTDGER